MLFQPKLSVITVVYNSKILIERTILSVINQSYVNIEYIIIDGASSDGTLQLAEKYQDTIALIQSGKDQGIYDAMNKGLKQATGDYVLFLNAGDEFFDSKTVTNIFATKENADVYYGNTAVVNRNGKILADRRLSPPDKLTWKNLQYGMCVSHQSFVARRTLCDFYNLDFKISADIDWVIKVLKEANTITNTNLYISKFLEGGTSNKRRKKALLERFEIMVIHYGFIRTVINHCYILFRFPFHYFFKKNMT